MNDTPTITAVQLSRYRIPFPNVGRDHSFAMGHFYEPDSTGHRMVLGVRIHTDLGITGEYMSIAPATFEQALMFVEYLIGKPACSASGSTAKPSRCCARTTAWAWDRSTSPCGIWRASSTTLPSTSCWAATGKDCPATPARTTPIANLTA